NDIAQDKQGYIWVATYFGLDRYDGYSIKKYYNSNEPLNNAFKNRLRCIYADDTGNIWLGTEGGLQCFNSRLEKYTDYSDKNKHNLFFEKVFKPAGNILYGLNGGVFKAYVIKGESVEERKLKIAHGLLFTDMTPDRNGVLYVSSNKGLWVLDKNGSLKKVAIAGLPDESTDIVRFDNENNLFVTSKNTAYLVGYGLSVIKEFTARKNNYVKDILEDSKGEYWINDGSSLLRLDHNLNLVQTVNNRSSQHSLNSVSLTKIFIDRTQCLWLCTFGGGLNYCDLNEKLFYTLQHNPEATANSLAGNHIRSVLAEGENIWIGTTANGLNAFNLRNHKFTYYNTYSSPVKLKNDVITALIFDREKNLWIGSSAGIEVLKPGGLQLWKPPGYDQFPTYVIDTFAEDCFGNIWFGNHMNKFGVIWKDKQNYYHVKYYGEGYFILGDKQIPQLFIASTHGLKREIIDEQGNIRQTFVYNASATNANSLSSDYTYPICKQNDSTYWVGTIGGGLNRLVLQKDNLYKIKRYEGTYGVFNDVESMEIDDSGNIWMGGNGLECLNPVTGKLIRYDKNDGLQGNSFKVGASYKGADGRLYFGGINGLNYFYPAQIKANSIVAMPVLTDILINNQKPQYGNSTTADNVISETIGHSKELRLSYVQNSFVIFFSSMHFANPLKCKYRYKLNGFDKDWRYTDGKNPSAAYANLDYSSYKFTVEATNNDGLWSKSVAETTITITPPWWKSVAAKVIYILLLISALSGIYIYQARWYRLKREIEVHEVSERKREEIHKQKEELYQQQLMFFTNVSHEFRTPLTLILGPLESLISQNKNAALDYSYQLMFRNAKRLINLISELMNFKKVADSIVKLQVQPLIINQFCTDLAWEFQNLAVNKCIDFKLTDHIADGDSSSLTAPFDVQVLEKILFNLLNNAFKYTNAGGQVFFEIFFDIDSFKPSFGNGFKLLNQDYRAKRYIYFRVADSGIGISGDSITRIFERYYRISKNHLGSGVGLAMVKSLTQLHKGDIYVYS
ncbi:MAG: two-component regulator propeller domain-containing protein, partial [Mucilaginibacter sp.]